MSKFQQINFLEQIQEVRRYTPAVLRHINGESGWYIEYTVFNSMLGIFERRRTYLNNIRKKFRTTAEFRMYANDILCDINIKLASGWTPWGDGESARSLIFLTEVLEKYLAEKSPSLRAATLKSYKSFITMLTRWIEKSKKGIKAYQFTKEVALEYLEYSTQQNNWSARTYNNNVKQGRAVFSWAVKKCYCKVNPFEAIDTLRAVKKTRTIIPVDAQQAIDKWFAANHPEMCIVMRMVYTSLLRPVEISRVQVNQIDFQNHCIHMPGDKTKNWEARDARLDHELEIMLAKHINGAMSTDYIFSYGKWTCGDKPMDPNHFTKAWERMRAGLVDSKGKRIIPSEYQLYSLRDTSINGMIKGGVDDLSVMQAAGHHDLKMTLIYANHADPTLIEKLNKEAPKFAQHA